MQEHEIEAVLRTLPTAARDIMRFHLVYSGMLPASGNKPKPDDVVRIRKVLSPQLKYLWETHNALKVLKREGAAQIGIAQTGIALLGGAVIRQPGVSPREIAARHPHIYEDLIQYIRVGETAYMPLVRKSLSLNCELEIKFLRQQDPGSLISQGGDIDNRIKVLLDALRMPTTDEQVNNPPELDEIYCLMESDTLVSRLDVDTDRLLVPQTDKAHEVHLVIEVSLNVLQVGQHNMCLL